MRKDVKGHIFDLEQVFEKRLTIGQLKALVNIEIQGHRASEQYCNGDLDSKQFEELEGNLFRIVRSILGDVGRCIYLNSDPRGYFLKVSDEYMRKNRDLELECDWGGYGIICPDWVQKAITESEG